MFGKKLKKKMTGAEASKSLEEKIEQLTQLAYFDTKTGIKNRNSFIRDYQNLNTPACIIALSINIEKINILFGKDKGDEMLAKAAAEFEKIYPDIYRIGGEKFNILIKKEDFDEAVLKEVYERLRAQMKNDGMFYDIYYGIAFEDEEEYLYEKRKLLDIAVERMFKDKSVKRPKNKNIQKLIEENERLIRLQEDNDKLREKVEKGRAVSQIKLEEALYAQLEILKKQVEVKKANRVKREIVKELTNVQSDTVIPFTQMESGDVRETEQDKKLVTMWWNEQHMTFIERNNFRDITIKIYPTEFLPPPRTVPVLVIIDDGIEYKLFSGTNVACGTCGTVLNVSGRFLKNGMFSTIISFEDAAVEKTVEADDIVQHKGLFTPCCFGKRIGDAKIYPIKTNVTGLCDSCVVYESGELKLSHGTETIGDIRYSFVLEKDRFCAEKN